MKPIKHIPRMPVDELGNKWNQFLIAKIAPGLIDKPPYMAGMGVSTVTTGTVRASMTVKYAYYPVTATSASLGSGAYIVVAHCPVLSIMRGTGGTNMMGTSTKLGGFAIWQIDDPNATFFNYNTFQDTRTAYAMSDIYGTDGRSVAAGAYIFSSQMDINFCAPAANVAGAVMRGKFLVSSMVDDAGSGTTFSINHLKRCVPKVKPMRAGKTYTGVNAVVDNDIVSRLYTTAAANSAPAVEVVDFWIFEVPY